MQKNSLTLTKKPSVSILIRTRNEQLTVRKLLESLFSQTERNFEIIIVDNNSTDQTLKILEEYNLKPNLEIPEGKFSHPKSLNDGIKLCNSNFIVITNGHCEPITKTWLVDGLDNFKNTKVAGISGHYYDPPGTTPLYQTIFDKFYFLFNFYIHKKVATNQKIKIHYDKNLTNTNSIIRKDRWQEYQFDESLIEGCEDYDWASEMISRKYDIVKDPKFSVYHSHAYRKENLWQALEKVRKWRRICGLIDLKQRPS